MKKKKTIQKMFLPPSMVITFYGKSEHFIYSISFPLFPLPFLSSLSLSHIPQPSSRSVCRLFCQAWNFVYNSKSRRPFCRSVMDLLDQRSLNLPVANWKLQDAPKYVSMLLHRINGFGEFSMAGFVDTACVHPEIF